MPNRIYIYIYSHAVTQPQKLLRITKNDFQTQLDNQSVYTFIHIFFILQSISPLTFD
jgi:hypothetical protein